MNKTGAISTSGSPFHCLFTVLRPFTFVLLLVFTISIRVNASPSTDSILARYKRYYLNSTSTRALDSLITSIAFTVNTSRKWSDINYADTSPAYWQVRTHLSRVELMAAAWANPASAYFN